MTSMTDPNHLKSNSEPCEWCGAKWEKGKLFPGSVSIKHAPGCEYIAWCKEREL